MGFREVWQNKYAQGVREECCIGDEEKYHNVIEKHMLLEIAISLRAGRGDVFKNVSLADIYGTIHFQFSLTKKAAKEPKRNDHAR